MKLSLAMVFLVCCAGGALADGGDAITATPTPDGRSTRLTSAAGTSVAVPLLEVNTIAVLKSPSGVESFLLSGRSCVECDENRSLYLVPAAYREGKLLRYDHPGKLSARDTGQMVQRVWAFYGDCVGTGKEALALLMSFKGADGRWHQAKSVLYPSDLPGHMENPLELKTTRAVIEKRVKAGACHELAGLDQRSEP